MNGRIATWLTRLKAVVFRRRMAVPVAALPAGHVPEASADYAFLEYMQVLAEHDAARVRAQRTGQPLVWP